MKERFNYEGVEAALAAWVGPEGADQDFDFSEYWAEVKSTVIAGNSVSISSLQQLDRKDTGFLVVYFIDKTTSSGHSSISLIDAVTEIEQLLETEEQRNQFSCKLARLGFQDKDKEKYKDYHFRVSDCAIFAVSEGFPRLTKKTVPPEINDAKYSIDLAAIASFEKQEI